MSTHRKHTSKAGAILRRVDKEEKPVSSFLAGVLMERVTDTRQASNSLTFPLSPAIPLVKNMCRMFSDARRLLG
jgi:hypothetical protein